MGGTTNVIYLFDGGEDDSIKNPEVLREIERLQALADSESWLVRKTYSIVDIIKDLNQAFHEDDPAYYRIPDTREEIAQYLILYESSGGEEAEEYVSSDYRRANLELRLRLDQGPRARGRGAHRRVRPRGAAGNDQRPPLGAALAPGRNVGGERRVPEPAQSNRASRRSRRAGADSRKDRHRKRAGSEGDPRFA